MGYLGQRNSTTTDTITYQETFDLQIATPATFRGLGGTIGCDPKEARHIWCSNLVACDLFHCNC